MFLLGKTFMDIFGTTSGGFVPPLIGNPGDTKSIGAIAGLGIILLAPDINKMMRKAFKAPEFDFAAIFGAIRAGQGVVTGTVKETATNIYAATHTALPKPEERGFGNVLRRVFR